ncbi:MAG: HlyD family efflux transporter periplasmic adaptor subunit [Verrucomicrobiae bacterium]|nr:HlyD family efflux transporter periplasmic adaptor subunit [Verrucomicrobiae bacterium]
MTPRLSQTLPPTDATDWLPDQPPPRWSRLAASLLLGLFTIAMISAWMIRLPETVRCRFKLVPAGGADPIQSPVQGVLAEVRVAEGQEVEEGSTLLVVRSDEVLTWQTALRGAEEDLRAMEERARRSEEAHRSLLEINTAGHEQLAQERSFRERYRDTVKDFVRRTRELRDLLLISEVELLRSELDLAAAEKDLNISGQSLHKNLLERTRLETERSLQRSEELAAMEKFRVMAASLRERLLNCESGSLLVRAPYRAVVVAVARQNAGGVVHPGIELCQLARVEGTPVVALTLPQGGLDQVAPGQTARLFFDAFPYQRYGTLPSQIDWVSLSAVASAGDLEFRGRARLEQTGFRVRDTLIPVRAGMVGEARIRVGERSLIEYAFEPLKALRERAR